jgi:preprotein translocase subunit SecG
MMILFLILILLASVVLGFIILVQNPKGGGLAGNIAGFSNQFMGVKQTTDVLEKGTWIFAVVIALLCTTQGQTPNTNPGTQPPANNPPKPNP